MLTSITDVIGAPPSPAQSAVSRGCSSTPVDDGHEPGDTFAAATGTPAGREATMATPEHQRSSEERVARELEAWFAQRCFDDWPPYSAFLTDARRPLYVALMRHGGPQYWAQEFGVAFIDRRPGPRRDEAEIRDRLRALYRQQRFKRFPSERWLREHGPRALAEQIKQTGVRHWARELGVPGPQPARWTDELIEAELRLLCLGRTCWPKKAEFAAAGLSGLLTAVTPRARQRVVGPAPRTAPTPTAVRTILIGPVTRQH